MPLPRPVPIAALPRSGKSTSLLHFANRKGYHFVSYGEDLSHCRSKDERYPNIASFMSFSQFVKNPPKDMIPVVIDDIDECIYRVTRNPVAAYTQTIGMDELAK